MPGLLWVFAIISVLQLSACATMFNQGPQPIYIETIPSSTVDVIVQEASEQAYKRTLPTIIYSTPSSFSDVSLSLDNKCYESSSTVIPKRVAQYYWFNFLNGHGLYIDFLTGYMWKYDERVILPLRRIEAQDDCNPSKFADKNAQDLNQDVQANGNNYLPIRLQKNRRFRKNMMGLTWSLNKSIDNRVDASAESGFGITYMRRISRENMVNISFKSVNRGGCGTYSCADYSTFQGTQLVSFRRYLAPDTNFYGGLGAARVNIRQEYYFSSFNNYVDEDTWSDSFTTLFLEMGWVVRQGVMSYQLHGVIDFSDIGLDRPSLSNSAYRNRDLSSRIVKKREREYLAASRITSVEFIAGFSF